MKNKKNNKSVYPNIRLNAEEQPLTWGDSGEWTHTPRTWISG